MIWTGITTGSSQKEVRYEALLGWLRLILGIGVVGCEKRTYVVCRGEAYCTAPLNHDEAMHASQLKKAWGDEHLYVRPGQ